MTHTAPTRTRGALFAVLVGGALAATAEVLQDYAFSHHVLTTGWLLVGGSYLLVGLMTATPVVLLRPGGRRIAAVAALLAVLAFVGGDIAYTAAAALRHGPAFQLLDYLRAYREFQSPRTLAEEAMAPLAAGLVTVLHTARFRWVPAVPVHIRQPAEVD